MFSSYPRSFLLHLVNSDNWFHSLRDTIRTERLLSSGHEKDNSTPQIIMPSAAFLYYKAYDHSPFAQYQPAIRTINIQLFSSVNMKVCLVHILSILLYLYWHLCIFYYYSCYFLFSSCCTISGVIQVNITLHFICWTVTNILNLCGECSECCTYKKLWIPYLFVKLRNIYLLNCVSSYE